MNDIALRNAEARCDLVKARISGFRKERRQLDELLTQAEVELADVEKFIDTWYELSGLQRSELSEQNMDMIARIKAPVDNPSRQEVAKAAIALICQAGRPLSRRDLFELMPSVNIRLQGKNPEMILSTMLWRTKNLIVRLPKYGYWPADTDYPEADFVALGSEQTSGRLL